MSTPVIKAEGLGKEYLIGAREAGRETFREMLTSSFAAPFRRFRRLSGEAAPEERIWALKDVSFEVAEGEVVGIIGRNGAGKSTLLKILSRITEPTEGRALIRGRVASLLEVGTGFHPELTGRENIRLNGAILGMSRAEIDRKFDEIVAFAEVEKFLDTPVKRYSSGMAVRLAFAVAAHLDPEILLVDEVLAVGDAAFQKKCLGTMTTIAATGRTILFVSHSMNSIRRLCSRVLFIQQGKVMEDGDATDVISHYLRMQEADTDSKSGSISCEDGYEYLMGVDLSDSQGRTTATFAYEEKFSLRVAFKAAESAGGMSLGINLVDALGNMIFSSWDTDSISKDQVVKGRKYEETCTINSRFLQPGHYILTVALVVHNRGWILHEETAKLSLEVSQVGYLRGPFYRTGVVAPDLEWDLKAL